MNSALQKQQPCHFYHMSVCNFDPCPYSHEGEPAGRCINTQCALCFQQYTQTGQPSANNPKRIHLPHDFMSFMLPYRRPKQFNKFMPGFSNTQFPFNQSLVGGGASTTFPIDTSIQQQLPVQQQLQQQLQQLQQQKKIRGRSQSPQRAPPKKELDSRKVQSEDEQWQCINCGFEQNSLTIIQCRQCSVPKINKKLNFELTEHDTELDYIFVIDFECTCTEDNSLELMEIIEFPIVVIDVQKRAIINTFSSFVKPSVNPILSDFCTNLTGITQQQVDKANSIEKVLKAVNYFLQPYLAYNTAILNDCCSDMKEFLLRETEYKQINLPDYLKKFINLKKIFPTITNKKNHIRKIKDLDTMLQSLDMEFIGRKHSGIVDAKNISRVVIELLNTGYKFCTRLVESIYPYRMTLGNQNYKYMILLSVQVKNKNPQKIKEVGGVIINLHKNQVIWGNVFHHQLDNKELSEKQKYQAVLNDLQTNFINQTDLKSQDFLVATLGRKQMDLLKFELTRNKIEIPAYLNKWVNLKKEIPEMRKKKEKKNVNSLYLIEEAMRILEIPQSQKIDSCQGSSSLMDAMSLAQIVRKLVIKGHIFSEEIKY